jgi:hypothetical protein
VIKRSEMREMWTCPRLFRGFLLNVRFWLYLRLTAQKYIKQLFGDCRGRNAHYWAPPAQIPACAIHAPGSHLG